MASFKGLKLGSSSESTSAQRTADTVHSKDTVEIILGLSEGPIKGLVDGAKSFYAGDTPLVDSTGTPNISNFDLKLYLGTNPGEVIVPNLGGTGASTEVNFPLKENGQSAVRNGQHTNIDYVDIRLAFSQLFMTNQKTGTTYPQSVAIKLEVKRRSSTWDNPYVPGVRAATSDSASLFQEGSGVSPVGRILNSAEHEVYAQATAPVPKASGAIWFNTSLSNAPPRVAVGTQWYVPNNLVGDVYQGFWSWSFLDNQATQRRAYWSPTGAVPAFPLGLYEFLVTPSAVDENGGAIQSYVWNGSAWVDSLAWASPGPQAPGLVIITDHITSTYVKTFRIAVPRVDEPFDVRVTRLSPKSDQYNITEFSWESFQEITVEPLQFADLAAAHLTILASDAFSSLPEFTMEAEGRIIRVPSNYNTQDRSYSGIWDGIFKFSYTDNPSWIAYDIVMNSRYGMNAYYPITLDKWDMYAFAQHCDKYRFTYNDYITEARPLKEMADYIVGIAGGRFIDRMDGFATVLFDADDQPAVAEFSAVNVIDGVFTYSFTDINERKNDFSPSFINPDLNWREDRVRVYNQEAIDLYGSNPEEFIAVGCIDETEAVKRGRLRLATALTEKRIVSFKTNRQGLYLDPFSVILVADEDMHEGVGGRVQSVIDTTHLQLRDPIYFEEGYSYQVTFTTSNGLVTYQLASMSGNQSTLVLAVPLSITLPEYAHFTLSQAEKIGVPKPYRITTIEEVEGEPDNVSISAIEVNRQKWAYVNGDVPLRDLITLQSGNTDGFVLPVDEPEIIPETTLDGQHNLLIRWRESQTPQIRSYRVYESINGSPMQIVGEPRAPSFTVYAVKPAVYTYTIVAVGLAGQESPPVTITHSISGINTVRGVAPPTGLFLEDEPTEGVFTTPSPTLAWVRPDGPFIDHFVVEIVNPTTNLVLRTVDTTETRYTYPFEDNVRDGLGHPYRSLRFRVYTVDSEGYLSAPATYNANNPTPGVLTVTLSSAGYALFVKWDKLPDTDLAGTLVWVSTSAGFDPTQIAPSYDGPNSSTAFPVTPGLTYYVRAGAYDAFGKQGMVISGEQSITIATLGDNIEAPPIPTTPVLTSTLEKRADGSIHTRLVATWGPGTGGAPTGTYDIAVNQDGGSFINYLTTEPTWSYDDLKPGSVIKARVRARSKNGAGVSGYSADATHTIAANNTPPGSATGLTATAAFSTVFLSWTNPVDLDLRYVEVWEGTTNDRAQATLIAKVSGTTFTRGGLPTNGPQTRYYWIRPVNTSGYFAAAFTPASATAGLSVTTAQVGGSDIAAAAIDSTKFASNLKAIGNVTSLPTVAGYTGPTTVSLNGVLYDLKNGVWVQTVSAANLTGQLTAAQLAANSVTFAAFDNGVTPIGIVSSLPNPVGYVGPKAVINNADGKLYRYVSGAWTTAVTGVDLTSTSFMANMVVNGDFQEGTVGASPPGWVVSSANIRIRGSAGAYSGAACLEMDRTTSAPGSNSVNVYGDRYFPVEPNKSYELNAFFKADSTTPQGVFLRALWSKADLSLTAAPGYTDAYANGGATTTWAKAGGVVVAPSDAAFVRIQIYHHSTSSARYLYVDNVSFKYTITSTLIEDDAITTPKIKAGAIVSGHMTADTIDGGVIKANSVDTKKLFADWLEAGNIRAGGIVADNLDVNSVSARNIVLTDPSNMLLNGSFYDPTKNVPSSDSWTLSATAVLHNRGAGDPLGIGAIYIPTVANENTQAAAADDIFCASGDSFHVQAVVYRGSNGLVGIYVAFLTESNALILQDWACYTNTGGFQNIKGQITAPTGCAKMSVRLVTTGRDGSNDAWGKVQVRRAANATMIVDGAVISSKIDTGAITARTLTLADTSNIILNGTFQNFASGAATTEGWTLGNGVAPQTSGPSDPGGMVRLRTSDPSTYYAATSTPDFAASEEDRFYVGLSVFNGRASGNAGAFVQFLDGNGGYLLNDAGAAGSLTYTSTKSSWTRIEGQTGSAPTGTVRARLILFGDTSASGDLYHGRIVVRRAGTAMMIVDGEIKAGKLSADSVVSSNIAAGAVKTLQLDAAAVTAKNLAVGNGLNLIYNGDFLAGKSGIAYASNIGATIEEGLATTNFGSYFHLPGMDAVYLHVTSPANPAAGGIMDFYCNRPLADGTWSQRFPVTPGQLYEASAYLSMHRCSACVRLTFWTLSDSPLTSFEGNTLTTNYANLQDPSTAPRSGVFAKAPPGAVSVSLTIRTTFTSESDPYIFMSGILLAPAQPNQTVLSPWTAGNYTVIDGESVRTGSIVTKHMQVGSIEGDRIKVDSLDARTLKSDSILSGSLLVSLEGGDQSISDIAGTASGASSAAAAAQSKANEDPASRINNGSTKILPGQILVAGSTTLFSLLNGADNTKIDGGSLAANTIDGNRLRIGVRGIDTLGLSFAYDKINNTLYWSTGYVTYLDQFGQYQAALIDAGARAWPGVWFSVWWKIGATSLQFTDGGKPTDPDAVTLATYWGGTLLNANYGKTIIDGSDIYTNSLTANLVTTGEFITLTAQIKDAIITNAKIANLDALKITTGTLAAERIGAASIDVTKLNVGSVSGNMIPNSDVLGGLINFIDSGGTRAIDYLGLASTSPGSIWAPTGMDAVAMHTTTGTDLGGFHDFDICNMGPNGKQTRWGCIAGQRYELSAYISSHRCSNFVFLYWFDVNGNAISANFGNSVDSYQSSGAFVNWARSGVVATAPPGAVTVELHVRQQAYTTANSDAWVMASAFFFAPATPNQTVLSPWTKGGTLSQITSQNVDAYIGAAAIGTLYLKDGVITNAKIEDATIEGAKIKNAAITNALIGDLEVSNLKLRNNTVCQGAGSAINIQDGGPYTSMVTRGTGFMLVVAVYDGVREFMSNYFTASGTSGNSTSVFTSTGYLNFYIDGVLKASKPMPDGVLSETTQLVTMPLSAGFHTFTVGITATLTRTTTTITESGGEGSAGSTTTTVSVETKTVTHGRAYLAVSEFSK